MSFQAMTWAIAQKAGSPSAKATLSSIANYANDQWAAWPRFELIADESEQSVDSVARRLKELAERGLLRRVRLKRAGRRWRDFLILAPSPLFMAAPDELADFLPAGCTTMPDDPRPTAEELAETLAADAADAELSAAEERRDREISAPADCGGSVGKKSAEGDGLYDPESPQSAGSQIPVEPPQPAAHVTATVRSLNQPLYEPRIPPKVPPVRGETGQAKEGAKEGGREATEPIGFAAFWVQYPDHETDNRRRAAAAFAALSQRDRDAATERVSRYAEQLARTARRPVGAARWLEEQRFSEYAPGAQSATYQRWFVPEASEPWKAACALAAVVFGTDLRMPKFWCVRGPDGVAGASVPLDFMNNWQPWLVPYGDWVFVEEATPQFRRWLGRVNEILGRSAALRAVGRIDTQGMRQRRLIGRDGNAWAEREYRGLLVPLEWPPGRTPRAPSAPDAPATGPPVELSPADADEFCNS